MIIRKPKMVLIDVDGTLVDSVPDLAYCVDEMLKAIDMAPHGEAEVRHWVGNGVERLVRRALIGQLDGEPDDELFEKAYPIFMELYKDNTSKRSSLYPGVKEGIEYLKQAGYQLGCVTNKAEAFTHPLLKDLGLFDYFESIVSGDTLDKKKPDPLPLLYSAEKMGVTAEDSLMLGDSISDVKAARAAGFQIICMTYGYNHGVDIRESNPDIVIDSMLELKELL
ncbi:MAG: phosphoglycolate phosphatase [gamma proteobacterium symbiont of Taylorina sp.]|nr:phosphoglycolate phosphatase [gamma proteobacterium symbiont of Taylorina sp.]